MQTHEIPKTGPSDWQPITEKWLLALLGKAGEELNEAAGKICRCVIQGLDEINPTTGRTNRAELEDEIADVEAMFALIRQYLILDEEKIQTRVAAKVEFKRPWIDDLAAQEFPQ